MKKLILILCLFVPVLVFGQWTSRIVKPHGEQGKVFAQDASTEATTQISYEHHEIHSGSHYFIRGYQMLGSGDTLTFALKTPNTTKWTHLLFQITGSLITEVKMFEGATVTGGSLLTPFNSNRNSDNVSVDSVWSLPTVPVYGTCIDSSKVGASGGSKFGGSITRDSEIILKQNTTYVWRIESGSASNYVMWDAEWYEHTDRN